MSKTTTKQPSLVDLLARASVADLAGIDQQIAAKQADLDAATKKLGDELDALKAIRKVIDIKLNGKPPRKVRQPKASTTDPVNRLPSSNGNGSGYTPGTQVDREAAGITVQSISAILKSCGACSPYTIARKLGPPATDYLVKTFLQKNKDKFMNEDGNTWDSIE